MVLAYPLGLGLMGVCIALAMFRYRFLDVAPVARATLIENMSAGMFVLDSSNRLVDLNPAMLRIAGLSGRAGQG